MAVRPIDAINLKKYIKGLDVSLPYDKQDKDDVIRQVCCIIDNWPTLTPPNEPLTLEQLREMNNEPIWVQNLEEPDKSQWRIIHWDRGKYIVLQGISVRGYLLDEYGESWLAYRRPPEGEANG